METASRRDVDGTRDISFQEDCLIGLPGLWIVQRPWNHVCRSPRTDPAGFDATATVELTCLRCLEQYAQPTKTRFQEEFRVAYDVRSGAAVRSSDDDERFAISDAHELDIREALRQELIVSLPMRPDCGAQCPGPPVIANDGDDETDNRFAALGALLNGSTED